MSPRSWSKRRQQRNRANHRNASEEEEYRNWLELPPEVISTILLKLGAIEILENARKVCTLWRNLCKDPSMWRSIDMRCLGDLFHMPYDLEKMAMHAVDLSCGQLIHINVEFFGSYELLNYIADRSKNLRRLRFVGCYGAIDDESMIEGAKKLPLLEELELTFCNVSREGLEAVGRSCPLLKSLKLNRPDDRHLLNVYPCDEEALAIAENMHELCHLQLLGNDLTEVGLKAILDGCPHLESLDLRQCFNINLGENLGKLCAERLKDLRHPNDSTDDFEFSAGLHGGEFCPSDIDLSYDIEDLVYEDGDEEDDYGSSGGSQILFYE